MVIPNNDPGCQPMSMLNLAGFLARSEVNGPGTRAVIWVQGCPHRCEGCFNTPFQPFSPATCLAVDELARAILAIRDIDGVTFSGGEPFSQAGSLAHLGIRLKTAGLDIVTYSGYSYDKLQTGADPTWLDLISVSDILIAGPYLKDRACTGRMAGSSNQQVIALTARGHEIMSETETGISGEMMEFTIGTDGAVTTTGFPEQEFIRQLASQSGGF
jgi:anaerobic ribonucleoside-triphosphate reductase activating protein